MIETRTSVADLKPGDRVKGWGMVTMIKQTNDDAILVGSDTAFESQWPISATVIVLTDEHRYRRTIIVESNDHGFVSNAMPADLVNVAQRRSRIGTELVYDSTQVIEAET